MLTVGLGDGSRSHQVPALRGNDTTSCQTGTRNGSCCCRAPTSGQLPNSGSLQQAGEGERSGELKQRGSPVPAQRQNKHWAIPALPRKLGIRTTESPPCMCVGGGGEQSPISCICPLPASRQQPPQSGSWRSGRDGFHTLCPFALRAACCSVHAWMGWEEHATEQPPLPTARRAAKETGPAPAVPLSC